MSEYFFGPVRGKVDEAHVDQMNKIARQHGAEWSWRVGSPGETAISCFAVPNGPSNDDVEKSVVRELEAAGLWPVPENKVRR